MKKFLFCPLCLIMGSCLPDGDTSSDKTLQLSKICEELDKYFDTLPTEDKKKQMRNISSVLLAFKKIYDVEKDNLTTTEEFSKWHKEIIDVLKGNSDFDQKFIEELLKDDLNKNAVDMFLDIYGELCNRLKEKNIFTTINNNKINKLKGDTSVIKIDEAVINGFKDKKENRSSL